MNEPDSRDPRLDAAYRDAATDEPPAAIDERIRAAARRAVAAGPQSLEARARADAQRSWTARWRVPVSIAATVLIAVTLSYMVQDEEVRKARIDGVPAGPAPAQESSAAPSTPATAAPAAKAQDAPAAPPALAKRAAPAADTAAASRIEPAAVPFPASPPAERQAPAVGGASASADRARENAALAKEVEQLQAESERRIAEEARMTSAQRLRSAPAPAAVPAPAPMAKPDPSRERALADRPAGRLEREAASGLAEQKVRTPEVWVEDIRRLKTQGRTEDAARELAEFRKRYPDYKLPADLLQ